jgi:hypothetical protein
MRGSERVDCVAGPPAVRDAVPVDAPTPRPFGVRAGAAERGGGLKSAAGFPWSIGCSAPAPPGSAGRRGMAIAAKASTTKPARTTVFRRFVWRCGDTRRPATGSDAPVRCGPIGVVPPKGEGAVDAEFVSFVLFTAVLTRCRDVCCGSALVVRRARFFGRAHFSGPTSAADTSNVQRTRRPGRRGGIAIARFDTERMAQRLCRVVSGRSWRDRASNPLQDGYSNCNCMRETGGTASAIRQLAEADANCLRAHLPQIRTAQTLKHRDLRSN